MIACKHQMIFMIQGQHIVGTASPGGCQTRGNPSARMPGRGRQTANAPVTGHRVPMGHGYRQTAKQGLTAPVGNLSDNKAVATPLRNWLSVAGSRASLGPGRATAQSCPQRYMTAGLSTRHHGLKAVGVRDQVPLFEQWYAPATAGWQRQRPTRWTGLYD